MLTHEFCYWLQGYFELRADDNPLTLEQVKCIRRHITLTKTVVNSMASALKKQELKHVLEKNGANLTTTNSFVAWLEGVLSMYEPHIDPKSDQAVYATEMIKEKLNECFAHEIDKKYDADPKETSDIHDGPNPKPRPHWDPFTPIKC